MKFCLNLALLPLALAMGATSAHASGVSFTCDASIGADFAAGVCTYLNTTTAALYNNTFTNASGSFYIQAGNEGLANSTSGYFNIVSYSTYESALQSVSTDAAKSTLSASEPSIFGGANVSITSSLAQALGITNADHTGGSTTGIAGIEADGSFCLTPGVGGCYNGIINVNDPTDLASQTGGQGYSYESLGGSTNGTTDNYDFFAVVEHEADEILGSASCIGLTNAGTVNDCNGDASAVDLFRYSASGVRAFSSQTPVDQYFSPDGGVTDTDGALYNTLKVGEDWADFSQGCLFVQDAEACPSSNPSTNSYSILTDGPGGTVGPEVAILNAVGYDLTSSTVVPTVPEPGTLSLLGTGILSVAGIVRRRRSMIA